MLSFKSLIMLFVLCCALLLVILPGPASRAQPASETNAETTAALDVVARINDYREEIGVHPLQINATLEQMARTQAEYLASLPDLPENGDYHAGPDGSYPRERATRDPYNWETYGSNSQIAIGENAAVGSVSFAMDYWLHSTLHYTALTNPEYREIGVAAVAHPFGYIFIAVFGARPDEIPVLVNPYTQRLYITNEFFTGGTGDWLREAQTIQVFNASGDPLTEAIPWRNTMPIPATDGTTLTVAFDDGTHQLTREVDLGRDVVLMPDTLALVQSLESGQAVAFVQTSAASATPASQGLPAAVVTATPVSLGLPAAAVTETPTFRDPFAVRPPQVTIVPASNQIVTDPDFRLIYEPHTLTLLNLRDEPIDISQVSLVGGEESIPVTAWRSAASFSPEAFFPGGCLQVWGWNEPFILPEPRVCGVRLAYISVAESARFWGSGDFVVMQGGTPIATCAVGARLCDVALLK